jgi:hypothetical protein
MFIWGCFGIFSPFWYIVPGKIWQPLSTHGRDSFYLFFSSAQQLLDRASLHPGFITLDVGRKVFGQIYIL